MFNRIQSRVLIPVLATITVVALVFSYLLYDVQRSEYLNGVDMRLRTAAHLAHEIVGRDYHDTIVAQRAELAAFNLAWIADLFERRTVGDTFDRSPQWHKDSFNQS